MGCKLIPPYGGINTSFLFFGLNMKNKITLSAKGYAPYPFIVPCTFVNLFEFCLNGKPIYFNYLSGDFYEVLYLGVYPKDITH